MTSLVLGKNFSHYVPAEVSGFDQDVTGKLYLSQSGYVYQHQSRAVLWIKLLGLGISLPIKALLNKVWQAVLYIFDDEVPSKGAYDLPHLFHLSGVAWKGVIGWKKSLAERASEYALKELDYHFESREEAMAINRSERITGGYYTAPCMHPLFSGEEYTEDINRAQSKTQLERELRALRTELRDRETAEATFFGFFRAPAQDRNSPFVHMTIGEISQRIGRIQSELMSRGSLDGRVKKYADIAVVKQYGCMRAKAVANNALEATTDTVSSALVEETNRVDCCGETCYREKRICCCVYQIECCGSTLCWAIDCICCMCCFSPSTGDCCIVT